MASMEVFAMVSFDGMTEASAGLWLRLGATPDSIWVDTTVDDAAMRDTWIWRALRPPIPGDLAQMKELRAAGWTALDVQTPSNLLPLLWGQFIDIVDRVHFPRSQTYTWVRSEDITRVRAAPVLLAFGLPPQAQPLLTVHTDLHSIRVAEPLPPPQFGEYGVVAGEDGRTLSIYPIAVLGREGLNLQRQIRTALTALVAPGDWWVLTEPLWRSLNGGDLREQIDDLHAALENSPDADDEERLGLNEELAELEAAQARGRLIVQLRHDQERLDVDDQVRRQTQQTAVRTACTALAHLYWVHHRSVQTSERVSQDQPITSVLPVEYGTGAPDHARAAAHTTPQRRSRIVKSIPPAPATTDAEVVHTPSPQSVDTIEGPPRATAPAASLPILTSNERTRLPSVESFRALTQSFGPGVQPSLWQDGTTPTGAILLHTPNGAYLRVQGANAWETTALHRYVADMLGPEGVKHMIGMLDAYHVQTGGGDRKADARVSLRQVLLRMGKGDHADDRDEQQKLMHHILYLASTYITVGERRDTAEHNARQKPLPLARQRRRPGKHKQNDYSPLLVIERLQPGPDGSIQIPSEVEFHLGAEFFETLFGEAQQFFTIPTGQLLSYHPTREQQELMLGIFLCGMIDTHNGTFSVGFSELLVQSALLSEAVVERGINRTRSATRVLYALERLEFDGLIVREPHMDVDVALAADLILDAATVQALAPATRERMSAEPFLVSMRRLPPEDIRTRRRQALQRLLRNTPSDIHLLTFSAGPLLQAQTERRTTQRRTSGSGRQRDSRGSVPRIVDAKTDNPDLVAASLPLK